MGDVIADESNNGSTLYSPVLPVARMEGMFKSGRLNKEWRLRRLRTRRWVQRARGRATRRVTVRKASLRSVRRLREETEMISET